MTRLICIVLILLYLSNPAYADLDVEMTIPLKSKEIYDPNKLIAGVAWHERAQVTLSNTGDKPLYDIEVIVDVPLQMDIELANQEISDINVEGQSIKTRIQELKPEESVDFIFGVKPPTSIEFKKNADFSISTRYTDDTGTHSDSVIHSVKIIPPPSWITYGTILASLLILVIVFATAWKFKVAEWFTTIDLITIALLAGLIGIVFRWFWQTFNDLLGPLGGLLFTIPITVLMLIALQLVRKPGTATLLFTVVELVAMVVWGTNVSMWMGWYMTEGVIVDALVIIFGRDYGDRRITAVIYGISRSAFSYWLFYFLFAPVVWKVYYAPWYVLSEVGIAAIGGLIGGIIGYDIARKMRGAVI